MAAISGEIAKANYDLFYKLLTQSRQSLGKAIAADENSLNTKRYVLTLYRKAIRELNSALNIQPAKCSSNKQAEIEEFRATLQKHVSLTQGRINDLLQYLRMDSDISASSTPNAGSSIQSNLPNRTILMKNINAKLAEELMSTVIDTTGVTMDDILGNDDAKRALEESVILPTLNPTLFTGLREPCKGILLFGPPGNGKTMLAKAVAAESRCTFFNISAATIMSKWVGEGEKLMQALFQMARNAQPSIIFIDEVDSLLCQRNDNESGVHRRVMTEFLLQFDGCSTRAEDRILVLGATNRPQDLDDGVLRRFPRRIYIDLPDEMARANLIRANFQKTNTSFRLSNNELINVAKLCAGYSSSDVTALCREAAMAPLRTLSRAELQNACATQVRPITFNDLKAATNVIRASSNPENTRKILDFARRFAQTC